MQISADLNLSEDRVFSNMWTSVKAFHYLLDTWPIEIDILQTKKSFIMPQLRFSKIANDSSLQWQIIYSS